jgi:hypothetical protein
MDTVTIQNVHSGQYSRNINLRSRDSSVDIVTDCGLEDEASIPDRSNMFPFSTAFQTDNGALNEPVIQWILLAFPLGVKRLERVADHSHVPSAEVRNAGASPPLLHAPPWPVA